jgi:hypothetical protein
VCSSGVSPLGHPGADDLTVLIDGAADIGPAAGELEIALINEPSVAGRVPCRTRGANELERESLDR